MRLYNVCFASDLRTNCNVSDPFPQYMRYTSVIVRYKSAVFATHSSTFTSCTPHGRASAFIREISAFVRHIFAMHI